MIDETFDITSVHDDYDHSHYRYKRHGPLFKKKRVRHRGFAPAMEPTDILLDMRVNTTTVRRQSSAIFQLDPRRPPKATATPFPPLKP